MVSLAAPPPPVLVSPTKDSIRAGASRQFAVQLYGVGGPIIWSVNGVIGGDGIGGAVSPAGLYTAPHQNPGVTPVVTCTAGTPPLSASATINWLNPEPVLASISPASVNVGTFTVNLNGSGFTRASQVSLNDTPATATWLSPTLITVQVTANTAGTIGVAVSNPDPGAATSSTRTLKVLEPITITLNPSATTVRLGASKKFSANLANAINRAVVWSVNGRVGGSPDAGVIAADGTYTAPENFVAGRVVKINVTSVADPKATAEAAVTLVNPLPVLQSLTPNPLTYGSQLILISGTGFVPTSVLRLGDATFPTQFISPTQLSATVMIAATLGNTLSFRVQNPDPGGSLSNPYFITIGAAASQMSYRSAARFLEQATWGAKPDAVAHVQELGFDAWLDEQIAAPVSLHKASDSTSDSLVSQQSEFFVHAIRNPDQLRQRVAFALSQIFVVSGLKTGEPRQMVPYQNLLRLDAFSTYAQVLRDVTLSPTMGVYLDLVNNDRADVGQGTAPNENYAREVAQLFSLGTVLLNPDGSIMRDAFAQPIPTYDQAAITDTARALTGWTYPGRQITHGHNQENYRGSMIPVALNHDTDSKIIISGLVLPPGRTAQQDLDDVLGALATHPNVPPFICLRLIEHLVTSNPSPGYLARISGKFVATGGNLAKVVRAILLDPEARAGDDPATPSVASDGHLREPILYLLSMLRTLSATVNDQNPIESLAADMGQTLFYAPSVFNYYSPLYRLPNGLQGPEFQLMNSATALVRINGVQNLVTRGLDGDVSFNLGPLQALASSPATLVDAVDAAFLFGRLPTGLKADIITAISATNDRSERVRTAIYLVTTSSLYQVQH